MADTAQSADCDLVLDMEERGVGVQEILQFARGLLGDGEIRALIDGLERLVESSEHDGVAPSSRESQREPKLEPTVQSGACALV